MSKSESLSNEQNNSKNKAQLTYEVLTQLQKSLDAFGIARQEKAYGALLRISIQNKIQLQNIIDIMELILVTKEINILEVVFPHRDNMHKKNGFILFIKGSPYDSIKSIFTKTDTSWEITAVKYEKPKINSSITENRENGNGQNRLFNRIEDDQFFESQYEIMVKNTMKKMRINKQEAEDHISMLFRWKTSSTISEYKSCLPQEDILFDDAHEPQFSQELQTLLQNESGPNNNGLGDVSTAFIARNENQIGLLPDGQHHCLFVCCMFCLKSLILLSLTILLYILTKRSPLLKVNIAVNFQKIFQLVG